MLLQFSIHYRTSWGQEVFVKTATETFPLRHAGNGWWQGSLEVKKLPQDFSYQYCCPSGGWKLDTRTEC
ncbi:MAG: hypothetical protein R2795_07125 [Saprospiraceae bacterium]